MPEILVLREEAQDRERHIAALEAELRSAAAERDEVRRTGPEPGPSQPVLLCFNAWTPARQAKVNGSWRISVKSSKTR